MNNVCIGRIPSGKQTNNTNTNTNTNANTNTNNGTVTANPKEAPCASPFLYLYSSISVSGAIRLLSPSFSPSAPPCLHYLSISSLSVSLP